MKKLPPVTLAIFPLLATLALPQNGPFTGWKEEKPGTVHKITPADLPAPYATPSASNSTPAPSRPADAWPQAPAGFKVQLYASGLHNPRLIEFAPNGDMFVAQMDAGSIIVFRGITADGKAEKMETFASGLRQPFGVAFYPPGPNPKYIYVGDVDAVLRFPYSNGDLQAGGQPETIVPNLPRGGHTTRNVVFSPDGKRMYIAVGSRSNVNDPDEDKTEFHRANVLVADPDGKNLRVYASGIRNPVGLAVDKKGVVWVSVNERDDLGDNLPPDYITHIEDGGFYGWPWYYIGGNQDPRHKGKHPELKDKVIVPDVLLQPHDASLEMTFYDAKQFPEPYHGIFAAEHGSWNHSARTGYEVIFVPLKNGKATGEYQDFLTGFMTPQGEPWGRPVGVGVAPDGALMVSDDGSNSIWRVTYSKR